MERWRFHKKYLAFSEYLNFNPLCPNFRLAQAMQSNGVLLFLTSILAIAKRSSVEIDISIIYLNNTLGFDEKKKINILSEK